MTASLHPERRPFLPIQMHRFSLMCVATLSQTKRQGMSKHVSLQTICIENTLSRLRIRRMETNTNNSTARPISRVWIFDVFTSLPLYFCFRYFVFLYQFILARRSLHQLKHSFTNELIFRQNSKLLLTYYLCVFNSYSTLFE